MTNIVSLCFKLFDIALNSLRTGIADGRSSVFSPDKVSLFLKFHTSFAAFYLLSIFLSPEWLHRVHSYLEFKTLSIIDRPVPGE